MQYSTEQVLAGIALSAFVTDLNGVITAVNDSFCRIISYDADELIGLSLSDITDDDAVRSDQNALQVLAQGEVPDAYLKDFVSPTQTLVPAETHAGKLDNDHVLFIVRGLTEEMQLLQDLQRRNQHLLAAAEVSKVATQIHQIQELLDKCVDLIRTHFGFYYAAIFLVDKAGKSAILRAATGEGGKKLLEAGHKLDVGSQSMVGWVTANNAARIALDVGEEAIRFDNPMLPKTRSEIALPLRVRGEVIGALDAQSTSVNAFSDEDIQTIQLMADQVAIAIDNAKLFDQHKE